MCHHTHHTQPVVKTLYHLKWDTRRKFIVCFYLPLKSASPLKCILWREQSIVSKSRGLGPHFCVKNSGSKPPTSVVVCLFNHSVSLFPDKGKIILCLTEFEIIWIAKKKKVFKDTWHTVTTVIYVKLFLVGYFVTIQCYHHFNVHLVLLMPGHSCPLTLFPENNSICIARWVHSFKNTMLDLLAQAFDPSYFVTSTFTQSCQLGPSYSGGWKVKACLGYRMSSKPTWAI